MNSKIIIANWKANPSTLAEAQELFRAEISEAAKYENVQTVICPPPAFLEELSKINSKKLGMQDFDEKQILKDAGLTHALVGHSDRRYGLGETDETINRKIKAALEAGIVPVLLVGEKNRRDNRRQVLEKQLSADLDGLDYDQISRVLIAYEPVWAISPDPGLGRDRGSSIRETNRDTQSNQAATPEYALEAIGLINNFLTTCYTLNSRPCLYGGSVNEKNIADFLSHPEISGAVIGGASLRKDEFAKILELASVLQVIIHQGIEP